MKQKIKQFYYFFSPKFQTLFLEYPVRFLPRYGEKKPAHQILYKVINENRATYRGLLETFLKHSDYFFSIKDAAVEKEESLPAWNNGFLPGLDMISIYGMIAYYQPKNYIEIGSGNSTKIARKSIIDNHLQTKITSIDPFPRAQIDHLSDNVIRKPFEQFENLESIIDTLQENDILFIDNSHRVFPNSDAMVTFMELLPRLRKGVVVHIHDIYLPYDYPQFMCDRFYNEQYFLAAFLMANPTKYCTLLPNYFISEDGELSQILAPIWLHPNLQNVERHGGSFWLQIGE